MERYLPLKRGDEVRIVSPARSLSIMGKQNQELSRKRLEQLGLKVSYGKNLTKPADAFASSSIKDRVADLHDAYGDKKVKLIMSVIGGHNSEEILDQLDYDLIRKNPKPFLGYSDITALQNAVYAKTGVIQFSGMSFASLSQRDGVEYSLDHLKKVLFSTKPFDVKPSATWTNSKWYIDQDNVAWVKNKGYVGLQNGEAEGTIVGGNMGTLQLLFGTQYMPNLNGAILFLEECEVGEEGEDATFKFFMRNFGSLLRQKGADGIKGIVIGRFPYNAFVTEDQLKEMIARRADKLKGVPVVYGADFGHTYPMISFPIGGKAKLSVKGKNINLKIGGR